MWKIFFILVILCPGELLAANRRRVCTNGHVQYTPCENNVLSKYRKVNKVTNNYSVKFSQISFKKINVTTGHWQGFISGEGETKLTLEILSAGKLIDSRYIGTTWLTKKEGPTKFNFISALPNKERWSWRIISPKVE